MQKFWVLTPKYENEYRYIQNLYRQDHDAFLHLHQKLTCARVVEEYTPYLWLNETHELKMMKHV